jgi:hypothetical protein
MFMSDESQFEDQKWPWIEYKDAVDTRAESLAQSLLRGIKRDDLNESNRDVQGMVINIFIRELNKIEVVEGVAAFFRCTKRALAWCALPDVPPEMALQLVGALNLLSLKRDHEIFASDEWKSYYARHKPLLDSPPDPRLQFPDSEG